MIAERPSFSLNAFNMWRNLQSDAAGIFSSSSANDSQSYDVEYDSQNRRILSKSSLYQNPDLFYGNVERTEPETKFDQNHENNVTKETSYDWTQQDWLKAGEETQHIESKIRKSKHNVLQKKLNEALAKPLKITKAERMMQKMGWSGGALGKTGEGIKEPVAPNAAYATSSKGFGQNATQPQGKIKLPKMKNDTNPFFDENYKENFNTNILLNILDFVCDDTEIEVVFDKELSKKERKTIHQIVQKVMDSESMIPMDYDNIAQMDIMQQIHKHCNYLLGTYSEDVDDDHRQLCVYKEAPEYVFLITPDDLHEQAEVTDDEKSVEKEVIIDCSNKTDEEHNKENETKESDKINNHEKESELEKKCEANNVSTVHEVTSSTEKETVVDNPINSDNYTINIDESLEISESDNAVIDANISERLQNICSIDSFDLKTLDKLLEFIIEFASQKDFGQLRFLGLFDWNQIDTINYVVNNLTRCLKNEEDFKIFADNGDELKKLLTSDEFQYSIKEDVNGSVVLHKTKKAS